MAKTILSAHHFIKKVSPYLLIFLLLFPLTWMNPRSTWDDYGYAFSYATHEKLESVGDYFTSAFAHYMKNNGRIWTNCTLTALFSAEKLDGLFKIMNALVFIGLIAFSIKLIKKKECDGNPIGWKETAVMFLLYWFLTPIPGETWLWMCGSLNYLWPTTMTVLFLYLILQSFNHSFSSISIMMLLPACLVFGWQNETFSAPLLGAMALYYLIKRPKLNRQTNLLCIAYTIGALFLIFAPGTVHRGTSSLMTTHSIGLSILLRLYVIGTLFFGLKLKATILLTAALIYLRYKSPQQFKAFCNRYLLLLLSIGFGIIFILIIVYLDYRALLGIEYASILLLFALFKQIITSSNCLFSKLKCKILASIVLVVFIVDYASAFKAVYRLSVGEQQIMSDYIASKDGIICSPFTQNDYASRFVSYGNEVSDQESVARYFSYDKEYYKPFHLIPEPFFKAMQGEEGFFTEKNRVKGSKSFYTLPNEIWYLAEIKDSTHLYIPVEKEYRFNKTSWIKKLLPSTAQMIEIFYSHTPMLYTYITVKGRKYLFINKMQRIIPGIELYKLDFKAQEQK